MGILKMLAEDIKNVYRWHKAKRIYKELLPYYNLKFKPRFAKENYMQALGDYDCYEHRIRINMRRMYPSLVTERYSIPEKQIMRFVIAHELRHAEQAEMGLLNFNMSTSCHHWNVPGEEKAVYAYSFFTRSVEDYLAYPWEVDANEKAMSVLRMMGLIDAKRLDTTDVAVGQRYKELVAKW